MASETEDRQTDSKGDSTVVKEEVGMASETEDRQTDSKGDSTVVMGRWGWLVRQRTDRQTVRETVQ